LPLLSKKPGLHGGCGQVQGTILTASWVVKQIVLVVGAFLACGRNSFPSEIYACYNREDASPRWTDAIRFGWYAFCEQASRRTENKEPGEP